MNTPWGSALAFRRHVRALFISDVHLGTRAARATDLLDFLKHYEPEVIYLVGDIVTLSREPCPHCGRLGERVVRTPRRTGSLVKCRGMLVNTDMVIDVLSAVEAIGVFQIVFLREEAPGSMDRMVIRIERDADDASLRERLVASAPARVVV